MLNKLTKAIFITISGRSIINKVYIFMRFAVYAVILAAFGVFFFGYRLPSVCDEPVAYRTGTIDEGFNMPQRELVERIGEAERLWEGASGRDLFAYSPDDENAVTVNMSFDRRQQTTQEVSDNQETVDSKKDALDPQIAEYERRRDVFEQRSAEFGETVAMYNSQGGAPEGEYEKLLAEQEELQREANALNDMARSLNQSAADYNRSVSQLNTSIDEFNTVARAKPEEGLYDPNTNTITVYYHITKDELVHTIAHELGHAVGIGHIASADALMYERVNVTLEPTAEDLAALEAVCARRTPYEQVRNTDWERFGRFYAQLFGRLLPQAQPGK